MTIAVTERYKFVIRRMLGHKEGLTDSYSFDPLYAWLSRIVLRAKILIYTQSEADSSGD